MGKVKLISWLLLIQLIFSACDIQGCKTCNGQGTICEQCQTDLHALIQDGTVCCDMMTHFIDADQNCIGCPPGCEICGDVFIDGIMTFGCSQCSEGYYISGGLCCDPDFGEFPNNANQCEECSNLVDNCGLCQYDEGSKKVSCKICQEHNGYYEAGGECCDSNIDKYPKADGTCQACDGIITGCQTCQVIQGVTSCAECKAGWEASGELCCESSADSYPKADGTCQACDGIITGCQTCQVIQGVTSCAECKAGWEASGELCCESSADSYPKADGTCQACDGIITGCQTCQVIQGVTSCAECKAGWEASGELCCESSADSYPKADGTCQACDGIITGCQTCQVIQGVTSCAECKAGWEASGELCCESSADSYPKADGTCQACDGIITGCQTCQVIQGVTSCAECKAGWEASGELCCESSADSYPKADGTCQACDGIITGCQTCQVIQGVTSCAECKAGWEASGELCCESSADSYPKADGTCQACDGIITGCQTCQVIQGVTSCAECKAGWEASGELCCESSADSYPKADGTCQACDGIITGCQTCQVIQGVTSCAECKAGWEASGELCCESSADSYPKADGTCQACDGIITGCQTCQVIQGVTSCAECKAGWEASGELCCESSADSYPKADGTCQACDGIITGCQTCQVIQGVTSCAECKAGWEASGELCCESSADSYPKADGTCQACDGIITGCQTCQVIQGVTSCAECKAGWEASGELCCESSADSYPKADGTCQACDGIITGCQTCQVIQGVTSCAECKAGWEASGELCCESSADSYPKADGTCQACDGIITGCQTCQVIQGVTSCAECKAGWEASGELCCESSADSYPKADGTCQACDGIITGCQTCQVIQGVTSCAECKAGWEASGELCCESSADSYPKADGTCQACDGIITGCQTCQVIQGVTSCAECKAGWEASGELCCESSADSYPKADGTCQACDGIITGCQTCQVIQGVTSCAECKAGWEASGELCCESSADSYPKADGTCQACDGIITGCQTCQVIQGVTSCAECKAGWEASGELCCESSADSYPKADGTCQACDGIITGCQTCQVIQGVTSCAECKAGWEASGELCCESSADSYPKADGTCQACDGIITGCQTCQVIQGVTSCAECKAGWEASGELCCESSADSYPKADGTCQACDGIITGCQTCQVIQGVTSCAECKAGWEASGELCCESSADSYPKADGTCQACDGIITGCQTCQVIQGVTSCAECKAGWEASGELCCESSADSYPKADGTCQACDGIITGCQTCQVIQGVTSCAECKAGWEASGELCCESSADSYPKADGTCQACDGIITGCQTCQVIQGVTSCAECKAGWEASGELCCESSADSYPKADGTCQACDGIITGCQTCQVIQGVTSCAECKAGWEASGELCCESSADSYPKADGTCQACDGIITGCQTCQVIQGVTSCAECKAGWEASGELCCESSADSYPKADGTCQACDGIITGCQTCQVIQGVTSCAECKAGWEASGELCCESSADSYPKADGTCQACDGIITGCQTCQVIQGVTSCAECKAGWEASGELCCDSSSDSYPNNQGSCSSCSSLISGCPACSYSDSTLYCEDCSSIMTGCVQCSDISTCLSCTSTYFLSSNQCSPCSQSINNCQTCSDENTCTFCDAGYALYEIFGDINCQYCSLSEYVSSDGQSCVHCSTIDSFCHECSDENTCEECISGYGVNNGNQCTLCSSIDVLCQRCADGECVECFSGHTLIDGSCQLVPLGNPGVVERNGEIFSCPGGCTACSDVSTCTACDTGYALEDPICSPCLSTCKNCKGSPGTCTDCYTGAYLHDDSCLPCEDNCLNCIDSQCLECSDGYYIDGQNCVSCGEFCAECSSAGCSACVLGYSVWEGQCKGCLAGCTSCHSDDITTCLDCSDGFYKSGGKCENCGDNCKKCSGETSCNACDYGFVLNDGECVQACQYPCFNCEVDDPTNCTKCFGGYTHDPSSDTCNFAASCNDSKNCESCSRGHFLSEGQCFNCEENCNFCSDQTTCTKCASGYYVSGGSCSECPKECETCSSDSNCQSCASGHYLEYDTAGNPTGMCKPCSEEVFCKECVLVASLCTACLDGYQLVDFKCVSKVRVGFNMTLDMELSEFLPKVHNFTDALITAANISTTETDHPVTFKKIQSGSVKIEGEINAYASTQGEKLVDYVGTLEGSTIGDEYTVLSASSERIGFQQPTQEPEPKEDFPTYAIVLLVILPLILIAFIVGYAKISKSKTSTSGGTDTSKPFTSKNSEHRINENF